MSTYKEPYTATAHDRYPAADYRGDLRRYLLPALLCLALLGLGYWLGWASGRNALLEGTYVNRGQLTDDPPRTQNYTDGVPGPSASDRVGR